MRYDSLDSRTLVASGDAVDLKGRQSHYCLQHLGRLVKPELLEFVRRLELLRSKTSIHKIRQLLPRSRPDVIVETFYLYSPCIGVVALGYDLAELAYRISGRAAGEPGVYVLGPRFQTHGQHHRSAETVGYGRPAA